MSSPVSEGGATPKGASPKGKDIKGKDIKGKDAKGKSKSQSPLYIGSSFDPEVVVGDLQKLLAKCASEHTELKALLSDPRLLTKGEFHITLEFFGRNVSDETIKQLTESLGQISQDPAAQVFVVKRCGISFYHDAATDQKQVKFICIEVEVHQPLKVLTKENFFPHITAYVGPEQKAVESPSVFTDQEAIVYELPEEVIWTGTPGCFYPGNRFCPLKTDKGID